MSPVDLAPAKQGNELQAVSPTGGLWGWAGRRVI